jgi:hypothetical protein
MKKFFVLMSALFFMLVTASYAPAERSNHKDDFEDEPLFTIERMVIAGSMDDRKPVGIVNLFASSTEKVYCYLEAADILEDTDVVFVWYYKDRVMARIELPLRQSSRWRTYSSKKLAGLKGIWKVALEDANGNVVKTVEFTVE